MDYNVAGLDPEPRAGFRSVKRRDAELERFSNAVWQRQERAARAPASRSWPGREAFKTNWPQLAFELIVAAWKIAGAQADSPVLELDVELLDPTPARRPHWRERYGEQLQPLFAAALEPRDGQAPGDNLELVFELCELTAAERLVLRAFLARLDLADIAADAHERLNTLQIRLRNALFRVHQVAENGRPAQRRLQRSVVGGYRGSSAASGRPRGAAPQRALATGARAHRLRRAS